MRSFEVDDKTNERPIEAARKALEAVDNCAVLLATGKTLKEYAIPEQVLDQVQEALQLLREGAAHSALN